jgi:DNA-binding GntR family transcriptional regulator
MMTETAEAPEYRRLPDRDESGETLPVQIARDLAVRIAAGEFPGRIPSIVGIGDDYEVSRGTAHRTLIAITAMGYAKRSAGRGYFVSPKGKRAARLTAEAVARGTDLMEAARATVGHDEA